jgi:hypothetical protein
MGYSYMASNAKWFHEYPHPLGLKFVLDKPFLTYNDKYLVVLTAQDYIQAKAAYDTPAICTFSMEEDMKDRNIVTEYGALNFISSCETKSM